MTDRDALREAVDAIVPYLHDLRGCPARDGFGCECGRDEAVRDLRAARAAPAPAALDVERLTLAVENVEWRGLVAEGRTPAPRIDSYRKSVRAQFERFAAEYERLAEETEP